MNFLLIALPDQHSCEEIKKYFSKYKVHLAFTKKDFEQSLKNKRFEVLILDISFIRDENRSKSYRENLRRIWNSSPNSQIISVLSQENIRDSVHLIKAGVTDYLTYPIKEEDLELVNDSLDIVTQHVDSNFLPTTFWEKEFLPMIQTNNQKMKDILEKVKAVAPTRSTILLTGETGTGKGVFSRLIHHHSNRRNKPLMNVHCGAIPDTLIESELFGHEKGAFTGALYSKPGKFEIAEGGTIFLDEIGTITHSTQVKLLQILQEKMYQRVGGQQNYTSDVRIIAATNSDLEAMSNDGSFRKDLFYRLNVFPIELPPLRERPEDIPILTELFLERLNATYCKEIIGIHPLLIENFMEYNWPGNIRELENTLERAYILEKTKILSVQIMNREIFSSELNPLQSPVPIDISLTLAEARQQGVHALEKNYIETLLSFHKGSIKLTAQSAGITTRQLNKLMTKYSIKKEQYKVKK